MRRTLMILSLLLVSTFFIACGERSTTVTNGNASQSAGANAGGASSSNGDRGASAGVGAKTQGIGGTSESNSGVVNGNTYTVPPGFNKNGDRGSASGNSNQPK